MGSIVGAVYAQSGDAQVTESKIKEFLQSSMFQQSQTEASQQGETGSFLEQLTDQICREKENAAEMRASIQQRDEAMASALTELLGDARIEDCAIPYAAVASDLLSGEEVVLKQGPLVQAVLASSALPGILSPVPLKEFLLVVGAASSSGPVRRTTQPGSATQSLFYPMRIRSLSEARPGAPAGPETQAEPAG